MNQVHIKNNFDKKELFSSETLGTILLDNKEVLKEILHSFIESISDLEYDITKSFDKKDHTELYRIMHNIYGAAANIGYVKFSSICHEIAKLNKNKDVWDDEKTKYLLQLYKEELINVKGHIKNDLNITL